MRTSLIMVGVAGALIAATVYVVQRSSPDSAPAAAGPFQHVDALPTAQYLFAHPDALRHAEQKCQDGSAPSSFYCSNVDKAQSLRMADQYRRAAERTLPAH